MNSELIQKIAWILVIIGGLNWGLVAIGNFISWNLNVVNLILGNWMWLENIVYLLVGISAVLVAIGARKVSSSNNSTMSSM